MILAAVGKTLEMFDLPIRRERIKISLYIFSDWLMQCFEAERRQRGITPPFFISSFSNSYNNVTSY